ncbi:GntR family transcriptional regulator [Acidaminobacter hydrogenoformans]|uniref:DNA-binding transcriptional regulator, GntR family n=1 Tax=Acidaminobacter hydrogenoformans DSM 2784 TaxID=1120920 RepID=A0A1G5RXU5_9FIRM|nr:GntR family transcriptional regulator [Acidaminobacter hydrogenoformans]SCZ78149.1 DNA-binding transcriptional regulator, GntR family [Acidaminobacter hydrogenoformans DSM 2784]
MTKQAKLVIPKKKAQNLTDIAYDSIKHMIIYNEIPAGEFLSENILAQALNMSRTPVREALKILASENLVEIHNGIGILVRNITTREVHELFEVRSALECAAVKSFLRNVTEEDLLEIERNWINSKEKLEAGEEIAYEDLAEYDHMLHSLIYDKSDNSVLKDIMHSIRQRIQRIQALSISKFPYHIVTIQQHLDIIQSIKLRDEEEIKRLLAEHILFAENNVLKNLDFHI